MSVIVYKKGVMAADTAAFRGNFLVSISARKIFRMANGDLIGCAGYAGDIEKFQHWALMYFPQHAKPEMGENFGAIVVNLDGKILEFDHKLEATDCTQEGYASEGDAQEFCFALHTMGLGAEEIVAQAIGYCVWAAGQVYALRLEEPAEPGLRAGDGDGDEAPFDNLQGTQSNFKDFPGIDDDPAAAERLSWLAERGL